MWVSKWVSWDFQASALRLDGTCHSLRSAAQLVLFGMEFKRNFERCSPSALRIASVMECGYSSLRARRLVIQAYPFN